jgi:hypothetical protein
LDAQFTHGAVEFRAPPRFALLFPPRNRRARLTTFARGSETEAVIDPTDPYEREAQTFPRLSHEQIARMAMFGRQELFPAGAVLFERRAGG